ncbi:MAG: nuclear transport factor 2 family protein, partial [Chloroflexi bacterium]|nr:nuclear transport factor 2 family protein [Chloroflexota bacterium]
MPARTPADADHQIIAAVNAGDIDAALALYEPGATFVAEPGKSATGTAAIREVLMGFIAMNPTMTIEVPIVIESGDTALLHSRWTLKGTGPDGSPVEMDMQGTEFLEGIADQDARTALAGHHAAVARLATGFAVEGRLVCNERDLGAFACLFYALAIDQQRRHLALGGLCRVTEEFAGAYLLADFEPHGLGGGIARALPGGAGLFLLAVHGGIEPGPVNAAALCAHGVLGQVDGKAVGVIQLEGHIAGQRRPGFEFSNRLAEQLEATGQGLAETVFLQLQCLGDQGLGAAKLGIGMAHLGDQRRHQLVEQQILRAQHMGVAHGAAHYPPQHITAPLVGGQDPLGDQKTHRTQVIGNHAECHAGFALFLILHAGESGNSLEQGHEQVRIVIGVHALNDSRDALEAHSRI